MCSSRYVPLAILVSACVVLSACEPAPSAGPDYVPVDNARLLSVCAPGPAVEFSGTAGVLGGTFEGGGVAVSIPAGALPEPVEFRIEVPSSSYAEVEIQANGRAHYQFQLPVVISIDYERCGTTVGELSVWHIDPDTRTLLENMGGVNDVLNKRITFSTMHLSGYAIAN